MADEKDKDKETRELPRGLSEPEIEGVFKRLLEKKAEGNPETLAQKLLRETLKLRAELADAKSAGLPKDHVALPRGEAALLDSYRKLGDPKALESSLATLATYQAIGDPDTIKATVEELPALKGDLARQKRQGQLNKLAEIRGYHAPVLSRPGVADGMEFVIAKVTDDKGDETESIEVKDVDAAGKPRTRKIEEVEAAEWKDLMPALRPASRPGGGDRAGQGSGTTRRELPIGTGGYHGGDQPRRTVSDRDREEDTGRRVAARRIGYGRM